MRLIFFGSGEFGLPTLALLQRAYEIVAVVSQPDRPTGRQRIPTPTPIGRWAAEQSLTLIKTDDVNQPDILRRIRDDNADAAVIIAFGQKLSEALIDASGRLAINLHASLLPKYRGAAPINHAIIQGEVQTGVSVIGLSQRMDAGLIYATAEAPIDPTETAGELHDRLAELGPTVMGRVLQDFSAGALQGCKQDEALATRAPKLSKADGVVDFRAGADEVRGRIHGLTPWPGVRVNWRRQASGADQSLFLRRVRSHLDFTHKAPPGAVLEGARVATGQGAVELMEVQIPGKRVMTIDEFLHGHALKPGDMLN